VIDLPEIQTRALADSRHWFPDVHRTDHDAIVHFSLGIAGEVGELVNLVKKVNRGSITFEQVRTMMTHEMADVLIYLCDIAETLGIDLATAVEEKREILIERWGAP
jgi:NTP pyrophosphatase (non-canonical NTP hydrolase)